MLPARVSSVTFGVSMRAASRLAAAAATGPPGIFEVRAATRAARVPAVRAVVITKHGGTEVLAVQERPEPAPGPGQVRIDVRAAGVNFADTLARVGLYADAPKPPCVVGYEVAGTISAVGEGVDAGRVGRARDGRHAVRRLRRRRSSSRAADVVALPERLSFEEGAAVPVVYATAWASLYRLRLAARGRARARPRGRRRCRHRRAAAGQARRRGGPRHGLARQARPIRANSASTARSTTATTAGGATCPPTIWSSTASAARRSSAPTRCCAPAGASSRSAPPRSRRARSATCAARCRRRCA